MPTVLDGCGQPHPIHCLCDVIVSQQTTITDDLVNGWLVREIISELRLLDIGSTTTLLDFLCAWVAVHDRFVEEQRTKMVRGTTFKPKNPELNDFVANLVVAGMTSTEIRRQVFNTFGIELTKSNASHMVRRTRERLLVNAS